MNKMAQWKSSILGINKSSHGGPVKGKMPMSAPMAKYANGGRVVKMQEGGNPGGRPKERAGTWSGTRPKALAALSRSASSVRNSGDSDTDSFKSRIKKVSDVSISKPKSADYGGTDAIEDVATAPVKIIIAKATPKARKKEAPMTDAEIMAWNKKNNPNYSHGGKVMADGGAADMKQDKAMIARHNRLMHSGQKSKLKNGGMMKKGDGGAMRVQGDMKRPQFSASKSFDGGKTRIGMSAGKGNFRASFSKKFADGGAVTRLANEASGVISDMTKNRAMMKKGGSVKKGSMMKAKGSMMKAMSNKR